MIKIIKDGLAYYLTEISYENFINGKFRTNNTANDLLRAAEIIIDINCNGILKCRQSMEYLVDASIDGVQKDKDRIEKLEEMLHWYVSGYGSSTAMSDAFNRHVMHVGGLGLLDDIEEFYRRNVE